jgi:hypothetical protein
VPRYTLFDRNHFGFRRDIATCHNCGYRFRYRAKGFAVIVTGISVFALSAVAMGVVAALQLPKFEEPVMMVICLGLLAMVLGSWFAGFEAAPQEIASTFTKNKRTVR